MLIMGVWYASPLAEVAGYAALAGLIALTVALWVKGSRLPQLLEIEPQETLYPVRTAAVALFCPALSVLVFCLGMSSGFTNNRVFDALITLPLAFGAIYGRRAFRAKWASSWVRGLGLIAMVVCVPSVILFSFITIFGVG